MLIVRVEKCMHHLVQKILNTKILQSKGYFTIFVRDCFAQGDVHICFDGVFNGTHFEFFVEDVIRGNSVQIALDFPAKSLSIYLNEFFLTPF